MTDVAVSSAAVEDRAVGVRARALALRRIAAHALAATLALVALGSSTGTLGNGREFFGVVATQVLVIGLGSAVAARAWRSGPLHATLVSACALACAAALALLPSPARPLALGAFALVVAASGAASAPAAREARRFAAGSAACTAYVLLLELPSFVHPLRDRWSELVSAAASTIGGSPIALGPGPAGVDLLVFGLCLLWTARSVSLVRRVAHVAGLFALQVAFAVAVPGLMTLQSLFVARLGVTAFSVAWVLAALVGTFVALAHAASREVVEPAAETRSARRSLAYAPLAALGVLLALALPSATVHAAEERAPRIAIHDPGTLDRSLVTSEWRGQFASGMFGLLAPFLEASGFDAEDVDLESVDLELYDAVVVINLIDSLSTDAVLRLRGFVERGGGLLLAGDHTGDEQIRDPSNAILEPWGIELAFDSAVPLRSSWADGMRFLRHPLTRSLGSETDVQIWTGASLELARPAYPVIVGRAAFSDAGNLDKGDASNLGDMHHHHDERLGDLALAAACEPELGRVFVLGDTSPLQTLALGNSRPFVRDAFDWLTSGPTSARERWLARARDAALFLALVGALVLRRFGLGALALVVPLALFSTFSFSERSWATPPLRDAEKEVAHIDLSHGQNFTRLGWYPDGIAGLQQCLLRAGFLPFLPARFDAELLDEAALLCVCAPTRDFDADELERLCAWIERGGVLLLAVGQPEAERVGGLLNELGLEVGTMPFGREESERDGRAFRFRAAFHFARLPDAAVVAARAFERPAAAWIPRGDGGTFAIADSRFFINDNLEDFDDYIPENVEHAVALLEELREAAR